MSLRIALVSDTHGLLRPRVLDLIAGVDHILHAGDVGKPEILETLATVAPVDAVRGNVDHGELSQLPDTAEGTFEDIHWRMVHRRDDIPRGWTRGAGLIVYGHSHRPEMEWRGGCLLLNPGAIGPRRFKLPLTLARLTVDGDRFVPELLAVD